MKKYLFTHNNIEVFEQIDTMSGLYYLFNDKKYHIKDLPDLHYPFYSLFTSNKEIYIKKLIDENKI